VLFIYVLIRELDKRTAGYVWEGVRWWQKWTDRKNGREIPASSETAWTKDHFNTTSKGRCVLASFYAAFSKQRIIEVNKIVSSFNVVA